jgi:hypothetical protein
MYRVSTFVIPACAFALTLGQGLNHANIRQSQQVDCTVSPFLSSFLSFSLMLGAPILAFEATAQPTSAGVLRVRESKPVIVNDAKFVVVTEADWKPGKLEQVVPIEIQLRITNLRKREVLFYTDFCSLKITNGAGKQIMPGEGSGRNGFTWARPLLIPPGASYSLIRRAELRWNTKTKASELAYFDGTGSISVFGPLESGRYKLSYYFADMADKRAKPEAKASESPSWVGNVVTEEVVIEVF